MSAGARKGRKCWGRQLPIPDTKADLYWGIGQLEKMTDAEVTALYMASPEFQELVKPALDEVDERNRTGYGRKVGRPSRWSALQLESVLLYRLVAGLDNIKLTRRTLLGDAQARLLLGLGEAVPSEPTITRYIRQHFPQERRAELYRELDRRLRQKVVRRPGFDREARIMGMDGSQHGTRFTAPIPEVGKDGRTTGRIVNAEKQSGEPGAITAPTAGFVGGDHPKSGKGWQMVGLFTEHGTPLAWDISPLHEGETTAAERVLANYETEIHPHRDPSTLSVCTTDAGFDSNALREQLQAMTIVPNMHRASHKTDHTQPGEETANAAKRNQKRTPFKHPSKLHYENWSANGHGELSCRCGAGQSKRSFPISKNGAVSPTTKGQCRSCGDVTITSGQWRLGSNQTHYVRCNGGDIPDPMIGNSLTFNDALAREYGKDRFGFGESVHATINRRFGLLQDKSPMRDVVEVETEFAVAFSVVSVLLLEREARRQNDGDMTPLRSAPTSEALPLAA